MLCFTDLSLTCDVSSPEFSSLAIILGGKVNILNGVKEDLISAVLWFM